MELQSLDTVGQVAGVVWSVATVDILARVHVGTKAPAAAIGPNVTAPVDIAAGRDVAGNTVDDAESRP